MISTLTRIGCANMGSPIDCMVSTVCPESVVRLSYLVARTPASRRVGFTVCRICSTSVCIRNNPVILRNPTSTGIDHLLRSTQGTLRERTHTRWTIENDHIIAAGSHCKLVSQAEPSIGHIKE